MIKRIVVTLELTYNHRETVIQYGERIPNPFDMGVVFDEITGALECSDYGVWGLRQANGGGVSHLQLVLVEDQVNE